MTDDFPHSLQTPLFATTAVIVIFIHAGSTTIMTTTDVLYGHFT
jgi:hypothetical protein